MEKNQEKLQTKFKYLGTVYTVPIETYQRCIKNNAIRRLFNQATTDDPNPHDQYFHIMSSDDGFFCAHSKNKTPIYRGIKHKTYKKLTKKQCKYLKDLALQCQDFREAIKITKLAVETIYEIS